MTLFKRKKHAENQKTTKQSTNESTDMSPSIRTISLHIPILSSAHMPSMRSRARLWCPRWRVFMISNHKQMSPDPGPQNASQDTSQHVSSWRVESRLEFHQKWVHFVCGIFFRTSVSAIDTCLALSNIGHHGHFLPMHRPHCTGYQEVRRNHL